MAKLRRLLPHGNKEPSVFAPMYEATYRKFIKSQIGISMGRWASVRAERDAMLPKFRQDIQNRLHAWMPVGSSIMVTATKLHTNEIQVIVHFEHQNGAKVHVRQCTNWG